MTTLLNLIKESGEDFEWYPTTDEMLDVVAQSINSRPSACTRQREMDGILDIGAGDGRALAYFKEHVEGGCGKYLAIEKSTTLTRQWPDYVFPIGSDFMLQGLFDKPVKTIFCNPPYSEYAQWMAKIVSEGFFLNAYLIVPTRWQDNAEIKRALDDRGFSAKAIWTGDFLNAERSARAKVDIVLICKESNTTWRGHTHKESYASDPFDKWFDTHFKFNESEDTTEEESTPLKDRALVNGKNLIEGLVVLYNDELKRLHASYKAITALEIQTLEDIGVNKDAVRGALREKINGLKNHYWKEVFDNLDKVTSRLTSKSRERMLERLMVAGNVDFDESNVYSVLIWVVKNANAYFDQQLVEVFQSLACTKSAKPYKSNRHFTEGTWRSLTGWDIAKGKGGAYSLDYRFVKEGSYYATTWAYGGEQRRLELIQDVVTVANNLGLKASLNGFDNEGWNAGESREISHESGTLLHARVYKNGNIHLKFDREFMARLNIEAGRLLGWLTSPEQAEEETGIKPDAWETSFQLDMQSAKALAA